MAASEIRRGPGWWMDLDGQWNPPEVWPEATPPLPGWTRTANGTWSPPRTFRPSLVVNDDTEDESVSDVVNAVPSLDTLDETETVESTDEASGPGLSFSDPVEVTPVKVDNRRELRNALGAMAIAALTASMIAAGLIVLLLLL